MKPIQSIICALAFAIATTTAWTESSPKGVTHLFPHRTDLIKDGDFANDPSVVFPQPTFQAVPKLPKGLVPGVYRLQIAFVIEKNGKVKEAVIMQSSGVSALDDAHLNAIKKWRFSPMEYKGEKIPCASRQPFKVEI